MSPTDCCDETRRFSIARRFGSAMISKTDSTPLIYPSEHILVKVYNRSRRQRAASYPRLERINRRKLNLQLVANVEDQHRTQRGKNEAGGVISCLHSARKKMGEG